MSTTKATVPAHTAPAPDCPMVDAPVEAQLDTCIRESRKLSRDILRFLGTKDAASQAAWVARSVEAGRVVFQPWNTEILFALAIHKRARFGELQKLLGVSSRTLSDKLQALAADGLVERTVYDEHPVRIEYALSKDGMSTAALATALFAELNHRSMRA